MSNIPINYVLYKKHFFWAFYFVIAGFVSAECLDICQQTFFGVNTPMSLLFTVTLSF